MRTVAMTAVAVLVVAAVASAQTALAPFNTFRLYPTEADFMRAIQPYQQAITANARNARAQYWLGFAYLYGYRQALAGLAPYAGGYLPKAVPPLQEAIKLDPATGDAYLALHDVYHMMGDEAKAAEVISQMIQRTLPSWLAEEALPATTLP